MTTDGDQRAEVRHAYGPSPLVQCLAGLCGAVCGLGAAAQIGRLLHGESSALLGALVWLLPVWFGATALLKRIVVDDDGIRSRSILGSRWAGWDAVVRVEQTRGGFVVVTPTGPISAGWLRPADRERLLRTVLHRARMMPSGDPPPTGIRMIYVRRRAPIRLVERRAPSPVDAAETQTNGHT